MVWKGHGLYPYYVPGLVHIVGVQLTSTVEQLTPTLPAHAPCQVRISISHFTGEETKLHSRPGAAQPEVAELGFQVWWCGYYSFLYPHISQA